MSYSNGAPNKRVRCAGTPGMMSGLVAAVRAGRCSALGFVPFAEAFERHHDLIGLHPTAAFKVDKRKRND
jgi:hypothetical protein